MVLAQRNRTDNVHSIFGDIKRLLTVSLSILLLLSLGEAGYAAELPKAASEQAKPIVLKDDSPVAIFSGLHMLTPPLSESSSVEAVVSGQLDDQFEPVPPLSEPPRYRYVWYYFDLQKPLLDKQKLVLNFNDILYDSIELYFQVDDGWRQVSTGGLIPYNKRPIKYAYLALPFEFGSKPVQRYYLRLKTSTLPVFHPTVSTMALFAESATGVRTLNAFATGLLVSLVFYLVLGLYMQFGRPGIDAMLLSAVIVCVTVNYAYLSGYTYILLPDNQTVHLGIYCYSLALYQIFLNLFLCRFFANARSIASCTNILLLAPVVLTIGLVTLSPWFGVRFVSNALINITSVNLLTVTLVSIYYLIRGRQGAALILMGFIVNIGCILNTVGVDGFMKYYEWNREAYTFGLVFQLGMIAIALVRKLRVLHANPKIPSNAFEIAEACSAGNVRFLEKISHELRTPIHGVLGMAQMLEVSGLNSTQKEYATVISHSGKTLLNVIDDILDFSKIESGRFELNPVDFDLDDLMMKNEAIFFIEFGQQNLYYRTRISPDCPYAVTGDPLRIQQILNNLLSNALMFTREGGVEIEVSVVSRDYEEAVLAFRVSDTGIGIEEEHQEKLFTPFAMRESEMVGQHGGSGLGLVITKQLVEVMGGKLTLKSVFGRGTDVIFEIPLKVDEHVENKRLSMYPGLHNKKIKFLASVEYHMHTIEQLIASWGCEVDADCPASVTLPELLDIGTQGYDLLIIRGYFLATLSEEERRKFCELPVPILVLESADAYGFTGLDGHFDNVRALMRPCTLTKFRQSVAISMGLERVGRIAVERTFANLKFRMEDLRVLVVEDNPTNRLVIASMLKNYGVQIDLVENGQQCIDFYKRKFQDIDVILMDCEMPVIDGCQASYEIRRFEAANGIFSTPIVALTAHAIPEQKEKCFEAGMDDVLTKPVSMDELGEMLKRYVKFVSPEKKVG